MTLIANSAAFINDKVLFMQVVEIKLEIPFLSLSSEIAMYAIFLLCELTSIKMLNQC